MRLEIRRSESTTLRFQRKDAAGSVIMDKPDDIFFTVKKHYEADQPSIQKKLSDGGILFDASTGWYRIELTTECVLVDKPEPAPAAPAAAPGMGGMM